MLVPCTNANASPAWRLYRYPQPLCFFRFLEGRVPKRKLTWSSEHTVSAHVPALFLRVLPLRLATTRAPTTPSTGTMTFALCTSTNHLASRHTKVLTPEERGGGQHPTIVSLLYG